MLFKCHHEVNLMLFHPYWIIQVLQLTDFLLISGQQLQQPPQQHLESLHVDDSFRRAVADADGPNRWDYYRTPSEYLVEKTPQGHRRIRGVHKGAALAILSNIFCPTMYQYLI